MERERGQRQVSLIAQWAHHMKTPVSVIDLLLQRAKDEAWPADVKALLGSVGEENQRLQHSKRTGASPSGSTGKGLTSS